MALEGAIHETTECRLVLVEPDSRKLLALDGNGGCRLPLVRIPPWTRPVEQLRKAAKTAWGLDVFILDFLYSQPATGYWAIAELLGPNSSNELKPVTLEELSGCELSEQQRLHFTAVLAGKIDSPFSRLGWIDKAVAWLEAVTHERLSSKRSIDQLNAGGAFCLLRFQTEGGRHYWLKATGKPNIHELSVTSVLSDVCEGYLPELISLERSWNAWLMSGEAAPIGELPTDPLQLFQFLKEAVESMAQIQIRTIGRGRDLLAAGAYQHGPQVFLNHSEALFDYLGEAMTLQTSSKAPRLERARLQEIRTILENVCRRMEDLGLPETILHGDLNPGNILIGSQHCQFIDWSEAYFGNPLISLEHLLLLNKVNNPKSRDFINRSLKGCYREVWSAIVDPTLFDAGFVYMPLLAVVSSLLGRGDWLTSSQRYDALRQSYARSLARYMDRATHAPELLEGLCH